MMVRDRVLNIPHWALFHKSFSFVDTLNYCFSPPKIPLIGIKVNLSDAQYENSIKRTIIRER